MKVRVYTLHTLETLQLWTFSVSGVNTLVSPSQRHIFRAPLKKELASYQNVANKRVCIF